MKGTVIVWYTVPVGAKVDLATGEVVQVATMDELVAIDPTEGTKGVTDESYDGGVSKKRAKRAIAIAQGEGDYSGEWPPWESGW